jgi:hypothetical protein
VSHAAPAHCGVPMRGLVVDGLPRGLRRWICDRCRTRLWFLDGEPVTDDEALAYTWELAQEEVHREQAQCR